MNKIPTWFLIVLGFSPVGALLPLIVLNGACIAFGTRPYCGIATIEGYAAFINTWMLTSAYFFGIGLLWVLAMLYVWGTLGYRVIMWSKKRTVTA